MLPGGNGYSSLKQTLLTFIVSKFCYRDLKLKTAEPKLLKDK